jgi:hypothetical protein
MAFSDILSSLNANFAVAVQVSNTLNVPGASAPMTFKAAIGIDDTYVLGDGSGSANTQQVNLPYFEQRVLMPGASETIDLSNIPGSLYGGAANYFQASGFALINGIAIVILPNTNKTIAYRMQIGGGPNPWAGWLSAGALETIDADGTPYIHQSETGRPVSPTSKNLLIANLDTLYVMTYQIIVVGLHS